MIVQRVDAVVPRILDHPTAGTHLRIVGEWRGVLRDATQVSLSEPHHCQSSAVLENCRPAVSIVTQSQHECSHFRENLTRHVLPLLGDRPLTKITRADGRLLITTSRERDCGSTPSRASRER